jgi:hypothetical protein
MKKNMTKILLKIYNHDQGLLKATAKIVAFIAIILLCKVSSFSQTTISCPNITSCSDSRTIVIDLDATTGTNVVPLCSSGNTLGVLGNISNNNDCFLAKEDRPNNCPGSPKKDLNCFKFRIVRGANSLFQQFKVHVGQGSGCQGQLDFSWQDFDGQCKQLSCAGAGNIVTITFPVGVNFIDFYACVNSTASVSLCSLCKVDPPCTSAPLCNLVDLNLTGCTIPPALTTPSSVFTNIGTCTGVTINMTSKDEGDLTVCDGANFERTYTLLFNGIPFRECKQEIKVTPPLLKVTCPEAVSLDACQSQMTILAAYNAWKAGFSVSSGCTENFGEV